MANWYKVGDYCFSFLELSFKRWMQYWAEPSASLGKGRSVFSWAGGDPGWLAQQINCLEPVTLSIHVGFTWFLHVSTNQVMIFPM